MAMVGVLASVAGGAMGMMQANYQAQVAENNAKIAKLNAGIASQRGGIAAQEQDVQAAQLQGEQLAGQAASGVSVSGQSQIQTREQARLFAASDRMHIRENANYESYGYRAQAANFKAEAASSRMSGIASMVGGVLSGIGGMAGTSFGQSLIGGSSGTSGATTSVAPSQQTAVSQIPIPKPKPIMPVLSRPQNYFNPLTRKKMGTY